MQLPRLRIRTLMIAVGVVALFLAAGLTLHRRSAIPSVGPIAR